MPDDMSTTSTTGTPQDPSATDGSQDTPDLGDPGKKALAAERAAKREAEKRAAELERQLKEFADRDKTEAQRLAERAAAAEQEAQTRAVELARYKVAAQTGVPADLLMPAAFDEDSLTAYAARLLEWRQGATPSTPTGPVVVQVDQGVRTPPHALNGDGLLDALNRSLGIR